MIKNKGISNVVSNTYNILSICSGVGGLDLAVGLAVENAFTVCHVEREAQAAAVLATRMEDGSLHEAPVWSDLSTFDGRPWRGLVDCIISGDPCQPNSVAGSQRGAEDDRFLIDELIRVVKEVRPSRLFRENVTGNADGQLAALIPALEELGYSVAAGIFSAGEVGASHRRERLFIMANAKSDVGPRLREREEQEQPKLGGGGGDVADTKCSERRPRQSGGHVANRETAQRQEAASGIGKSGEDLANAQSRKRAMGEAERREPQEHIAGGSGELADALRTEPQGQQSGQHDATGRQIKDGFTSLRCGTKLPIFAPGPSDEIWQSIVTQSPFLAPSLAGLDVAEGSITQAINAMGEANPQEAAQSIFRRMADGLASRVDRLRAGGNGVCSMAGAVAWLSLANHFEE